MDGVWGDGGKNVICRGGNKYIYSSIVLIFYFKYFTSVFPVYAPLYSTTFENIVLHFIYLTVSSYFAD